MTRPALPVDRADRARALSQLAIDTVVACGPLSPRDLIAQLEHLRQDLQPGESTAAVWSTIKDGRLEIGPSSLVRVKATR